MKEPRLAVKSFIVNEQGKLLMVRRSKHDSQTPGVWEIPGGRLEPGEDPFKGLKRETLEETGLDIEILNPLRIHHFTRDDGQKITLISFLCRPLSGSIILSDEHSVCKWSSIEDSLSLLHPGFHEDVELFSKFFRPAFMANQE